jgi:hypothetical protein
MKWVLFTMLLCAVGPTQASAQNEISQQLLELDQDQRNAAFTHMLWDSNRKCDQVIRTAFSGTLLGVDDWEVLCRDRRSYSISVLVELELHDTIITSLSCRELLATSKRLLHKAGSNRQATGCKMKVLECGASLSSRCACAKRRSRSAGCSCPIAAVPCPRGSTRKD